MVYRLDIKLIHIFIFSIFLSFAASYFSNIYIEAISAVIILVASFLSILLNRNKNLNNYLISMGFLLLAIIFGIIFLDAKLLSSLNMFVYLGIILSILNLSLQTKLKQLLRKINFLYSLFFIAIYFLFQMGIELPFVKYYGEGGSFRFAFIFPEPVICSIFMVFGFLFSKGFWETIATATGIVLAGSIGGIILLLLIIVFRVFSRSNVSSQIILFTIGLVLIAIINYLFSQRIINILSFADGSTQIRLAIIFAQLSIFMDNLALGVGIGNSRYYLDLYLDSFISSVWMREIQPQSILVLLLGEFGLFLGALLILIFYANIKKLFFRWKKILFIVVLFTVHGQLIWLPLVIYIGMIFNDNELKFYAK